MSKIFTYITILLGFVPGVTSCIKNDIPYPRVDFSLTSITVDGATLSSSVKRGDSVFVTLMCNEEVDVRTAMFRSLALANGDKAVIEYAEGGVPADGDKWNLRAGTTLVVDVYGYKEYWKFVATQQIERRFKVDGQIGQSIFEENQSGDSENRIAMALVPAGTDFSKINVTELKLGPEGCTEITPALSGITDFTDNIQEVRVTYRDVVENWRVIIKEGETSVTSVDAWGRVAWIQAAGVAGENHAIEYRKASDSNWTRAEITDNGSMFTAHVTGLLPLTAYVCRAISAANVSDEFEFATEDTPALTVNGFDSWHKDGKCWNPWDKSDPVIHSFYDTHDSGEERFDIHYWDTGNHGAVTLGESNSIPLSEAVTRGWYADATPHSGADAAYLRSKFVGIGLAGKLAGGNIFTGTFGVIQGTNGTTYLGIPFSSHPVRLTGYYKYKPLPIDNVIKPNSKYPNDGAFITEEWRGKSDSLHIVFALGTWAIPHEVRTDRSNRSDFTDKTKGVIAWGDMTSAEEKADWTRFEVELDYFDKTTKPTYLVVMITASKWCDYFTGADGSTLIVDDISLEYE